MSYEGKVLGATGESLAANLLQKKGLQVLKRNFATKFGEIDILARDGNTVAVVEVKTKTSDAKGAAVEMITPAKQRKLILLAHELQSTYQTDNVRIDVVTVDEVGLTPQLRYHKGIIELNG